MRIIVFSLVIVLLMSCETTRGHQGFVNHLNRGIGKKAIAVEPFQYDDAGYLSSGGSIMGRKGITHVTMNKHGDLVLHWAGKEVLPNYPSVSGRNIVGRCFIYQVVDAQTHIIKRWGFDKGGNPLSCRKWRTWNWD